jgi:2-C-methyl-D-erythritol 4-phosphate cytidylyltransferase
MKSKIVAIIPAGGMGSRMKLPQKKQFVCILNKPLIQWTLDHFIEHEEIDQIVVSLPKENIEDFKKLKLSSSGKEITIVEGDRHRQGSVFNALKACSNDTDYVCIHDAVRPFVKPEDISMLIDAAKKDKAVIASSPVKNTIKLIEDQHIVYTLPRKSLINALTPQVFAFNLIKTYHRKAMELDLQFTDDASILEHFGYRVIYKHTSPLNIKITDIEDLKLAEMIIKTNNK